MREGCSSSETPEITSLLPIDSRDSWDLLDEIVAGQPTTKDRDNVIPRIQKNTRYIYMADDKKKMR